jgi:hypothetical protein
MAIVNQFPTKLSFLNGGKTISLKNYSDAARLRNNFSFLRLWLSSLTIFLFFLIFSCNRVTPPAPARTMLDSTLVVPVSELNVPVLYPVQDLEDMINDKLNAKIIEANMPISKGDDSLFLSISRFQPVKLTYDGVRGITFKLPVQIVGFVKSKVLGIKIKNKTPVEAKIIITMYSDLYMDKQWNIVTKTQLKSIEWVEEPKIKVAGIKFNLKPPIEKAIEKNKEKIIEKLDSSTGDILKVRQEVVKLWGDIQKPIRINKKIVSVWLKGEAENMNGILVQQSKDTLMIEAGLYATLRTIFDSAASIKEIKPLPDFQRKEFAEPGLSAYVHAILPFEKLNSLINQVTDTMKFDFGSHSVKIKSSEIYGTPEGIAIRVTFHGDLNADLYLRGTIGFDSLQRKLIIDNFAFDINSEQSLLSTADWFVHDDILERVKPYLSLPVDKAFEAIPQLISKGIEKGKLGQKIDLHFADLKVNIYQHLVTKDNIQIIISAKGKADIRLKKELFNKKKPV